MAISPSANASTRRPRAARASFWASSAARSIGTGAPAQSMRSAMAIKRLRRALDEDAHPLLAVMERGSILQVGLIGDAGDQRMRVGQLLVNDAALARGGEQSDVDGVAGGFPAVLAAAKPRLVRQRRRPQQRIRARARRGLVQVGRMDPEGVQIGPRVESDLRAVRQDDLRHGQLVQGQRAGLVGSDDRAGAERLDRRHVAHDHVGLGHAPHADRERHRDRDRQPFGNRADRQADRHQEEGVETHAAQKADPDEQRHRHAHRERDGAREALHPDHQRRLRDRAPRDHLGDPADLRSPPRSP